ncbi:hypothetical protein [Kineosporia succinea]|uniref:Antibiotic biosynthesis monooxygenase n=1 Tax=Kineosporia succinea TaxID=84632 RepID=A0ABT9PB92_9ACTN|nr:hypothetical protein [Kineosporia succinea]MDP9829664.1 hypothetical protein [Kineosporia succinea]
MGNAFVVQYETSSEKADENQRLVEAVFAELAAKAPAGLSYASFRLADGVSFVHVGRYEGEGDSPLPALDAFKEFAAGMADRAPAGARPSGATLIGEYGFGD